MGLVFGDNQLVTGGPGADDYDVIGENNTINGAGGDDNINTSEGGNNFLNGDAGNDFLRGHGDDGSGDDFDGGADTDDALIDLQNTTGDIIANLQGFGEAGGATLGTVTVKSVESAGIALGYGNDFVTLGTSADFSIFLGDGNDRAIGDVNADELAGGAGSDSLYGGGNGDLIWGFGPANFADAYVSLTLNGFDDGLGADRLYGEAGDDTIIGSLGNDTFNGGLGDDTASYDNIDNGVGQPGVSINLRKNVQETGASGQDRFVSIENVFGSGSDDLIKGDAGANALDGSRGADTLLGGLGADTLTGGNGADYFVYKSTAESGGASVDLITDYLVGDFLDLRGIDAKESKAGNQAFTEVEAFTGHEGELVQTYDSGGDLTTIALDTDGDSLADSVITLSGNVTDDFFIL